MAHFREGQLVWAKMRGHPHWPAKVARCPKNQPRPQGKFWIFFYGTHEHAWMPAADLCCYDNNREKYSVPKKVRGFAEAIWEIEEDPDLVITLGKPPSKRRRQSQDTTIHSKDGSTTTVEEEKKTSVETTPPISEDSDSHKYQTRRQRRKNKNDGIVAQITQKFAARMELRSPQQKHQISVESLINEIPTQSSDRGSGGERENVSKKYVTRSSSRHSNSDNRKPVVENQPRPQPHPLININEDMMVCEGDNQTVEEDEDKEEEEEEEVNKEVIEQKNGSSSETVTIEQEEKLVDKVGEDIETGMNDVVIEERDNDITSTQDDTVCNEETQVDMENEVTGGEVKKVEEQEKVEEVEDEKDVEKEKVEEEQCVVKGGEVPTMILNTVQPEKKVPAANEDDCLEPETADFDIAISEKKRSRRPGKIPLEEGMTIVEILMILNYNLKASLTIEDPDTQGAISILNQLLKVRPSREDLLATDLITTLRMVRRYSVNERIQKLASQVYSVMKNRYNHSCSIRQLMVTGGKAPSLKHDISTKISPNEVDTVANDQTVPSMNYDTQ